MKSNSARTYKETKRLENERSDNKRYCKHCGHSIVFPKVSKARKVICTHCGYYIFKNDKIEFEERLKSAKIRVNK